MYIYIQATGESVPAFKTRHDGPADHNFQLPQGPLFAWFTESMPINTSTYTALDMNTCTCIAAPTSFEHLHMFLRLRT